MLCFSGEEMGGVFVRFMVNVWEVKFVRLVMTMPIYSAGVNDLFGEMIVTRAIEAIKRVKTALRRPEPIVWVAVE